MNLSEKISLFHQEINYALNSQSISSLRIHGINVDETSKADIKVRAFHFTILSSERLVRSNLFFMNNQKEVWEPMLNSIYYLEKEMIQLALQCLYLSNTTLGECLVSREGKQLSVSKIQKIKVEQLSDSERDALENFFSKKELVMKEKITYGCDLEIMLMKESTRKFIDGATLTKNKQIGFDDAIAIHNHRVYRPIVEVRPMPADTIEELQETLNDLYEKISIEAREHQLMIITEPHPTGRYFLGGHIHFGHLPLTFQHVHLLDHFVMIPYAIVEKKPSYERRLHYGRLGAVKKNQFQGFEYRCLPTWFSDIPAFLPFLQWIQFLMENANHLPTRTTSKQSLEQFYQKTVKHNSLEEWVQRNKANFQDTDAAEVFSNFVSFLKGKRDSLESIT